MRQGQCVLRPEVNALLLLRLHLLHQLLLFHFVQNQDKGVDLVVHDTFKGLARVTRDCLAFIDKQAIQREVAQEICQSNMNSLLGPDSQHLCDL